MKRSYDYWNLRWNKNLKVFYRFLRQDKFIKSFQISTRSGKIKWKTIRIKSIEITNRNNSDQDKADFRIDFLNEEILEVKKEKDFLDSNLPQIISTKLIVKSMMI